MKEEKKNQENEKVIVIDINLTRGLAIVLAAALLLVAVLGTLTWGQRKAAASSPQAPASSTGMRQYYLTTALYEGGDADGTDGNGAGVCAAGYHFASLWELIDPSNLKYNTALGYTQDDGGQGPPSGVSSWIRTGYGSSTSPTPGTGNCDNWSSSSSAEDGTLASLNRYWDAANIFPAWRFTSSIDGCETDSRVWCVED